MNELSKFDELLSKKNEVMVHIAFCYRHFDSWKMYHFSRLVHYGGVYEPPHVFKYYVKGLQGKFHLMAKDDKLIFDEPERKFKMEVSSSLEIEIIEQEIKNFLEKIAKRGRIEALFSPSHFLFSEKMGSYAFYDGYLESTKKKIFNGLISKYTIEKIDTLDIKDDVDVYIEKPGVVILSFFKEIHCVVYGQRVKFFDDVQDAKRFASEINIIRRF